MGFSSSRGSQWYGVRTRAIGKGPELRPDVSALRLTGSTGDQSVGQLLLMVVRGRNLTGVDGSAVQPACSSHSVRCWMPPTRTVNQPSCRFTLACGSCWPVRGPSTSRPSVCRATVLQFPIDPAADGL
jgi:hypothetical protein